MPRVVVVDDEPITRMNISAMLQKLEFDVVGEAGDGFDAVELCREMHPDLVLMDVRMPVFDGLTAAETILHETLSDCVVLLTAYDDRDFVERAGMIGVTGYLVKPVDSRMLLPTLTVAMAQSRLLRASRAETEEARQRLRDNKTIQQAQALLETQYGLSAAAAYQKLQQMSMDKRTPMVLLAEAILAQNDRKAATIWVKQFLMEKNGCSESAAYRKIAAKAQQLGCSIEAAAEQMKRQVEER